MPRFTYLLALSSLASATIIANVKPSQQLKFGEPLDGFVSFSIEFSSFPDFAGNQSQPNEFSNNLLENLGSLTGQKPYIRVGGNTQDYAIFNPDLQIALNGTINATRSPDYPTTVEIGTKYFESFLTWPNTKYSYGFNLGGNHDSRVGETLVNAAALACKTLGKERLYLWEYGNEPDLYATSSQGPVRPITYNEADYVSEWLNGTRTIKSVIAKTCPDLVGNSSYGYLAPSFGGTGNHLKAPIAFQDGFDEDGVMRLYSTHNYIDGAMSPGVTLQGTLMNHTRTIASVAPHLAEFAEILPQVPGVTPIFGETNSLFNQGTPGLSNSFGAALWGIDFNLYSASVGIGRTHMHMGTNYRYASWQPIDTDLAVLGTKAPYYGNVAVAAFIGDKKSIQVAELELSQSNDGTEPEVGVQDSAYLAFVNNKLARIVLVNMREYNYTLNGAGDLNTLNPEARPVRTYNLTLPDIKDGSQATVRRLQANGSDAITGVTWDGMSYNFELDQGKPVRLQNVTTGEKVTVKNGVVLVTVPDSEAALLDFDA
ncbi:glycoside hydrolase family 79 protein [Xylaria sp. CBS 124048]|nr:glycoside hydrolase family 79 protein [Xylaria sp. CBS 124048]